MNVARLAVLLAGGLSAAGAKEAHTNLSVSVNVLAVAHLDIEFTPNAVELTAADLARGFIDVAQPTQLVVHSNSAQGYALDVLPLNRMASSIRVSGLDTSMVLSADGGTLVQRWHSPRPRTSRFAIPFRTRPLACRRDVILGPIHLAVRPLEAI